MNLEIKLINERYKQSNIDKPAEIAITWEVEMDDCSVHAWFEVFSSVLRAASFSESVIMRGACQCAFNETRDPPLMRKIAEEFDLTMNEYSHLQTSTND